jgi:hypothetical protein
MCWSFEASLVTWVIALITGIYLLYRNNKNDVILGILVLTYSTMQLWESLMWLDQKCGKLNSFATQAAYYALWSHLLAVGIGIYIEYKNPYVLALGAIAMVAAYVFKPAKINCSLKASNGHLAWGFDSRFYVIPFLAAIIATILIIRPIKTALVISALFIASFIFSIIVGGTPTEQTASSFWCWICAFFCFIFIYVNSDAVVTKFK